jgi:molecular chaperone IbpA
MNDLKTNTLSLFPRSSFVGFDHLFQDLEWVSRHATTDKYPPHNIVKFSDSDYQIEIAVAGFALNDLNIEQEENTLTVIGDKLKIEDEHEVEYIHKGISEKKFKRVFKLSEYVYVNGATLKDGILKINLKFEVPEEKRPRKIDIT